MLGTVTALIGVYDADGGVVGELSYLVRSAAGSAHCALCDITHGRLRERADWRSCRDALPVPFRTVHRDEATDAIRALGGTLPVVAAETSDGGTVLLLDRGAVESCEGSPVQLVDAVEAAMADRGLRFS